MKTVASGGDVGDLGGGAVAEKNLIFCDSQLASSFRQVKCNKARSRPGHYLHKVLLGKLKSQSEPRLDSEAAAEEPAGEAPQGAELASIAAADETKEDWYKTWPDCVDKEKLRTGLDEEPAPSDLTPNTPRPLKEVDLPLAYSPITKQLHIWRPENGYGPSASRSSPPTGSASCCSTEEPQQADNSDLPSIGTCSLTSEDEVVDHPKKNSLSDSFSRGLLNWKVRDQETASIFSRSGSSCSEDRRSLGSEQGVFGSSALIQLERPTWLPAKPSTEHQSHVDQYDKIMLYNRKKQLKEAKAQEKLLQSQLKVEEGAAASTRLWVQEIFPKWSTTQSQKKTQELWWQGIPPCVRGKIWKLAMPNVLNLTHDLYFICLSRATERLENTTRSSSDSLDQSASDRVNSMEQIKLDIGRTFPHLCIFQEKGPYHEMLHSVLAAYVCYRPDIGYVQGMSFIAAVLILNMDAPDAFICFANLLNRPLHRAFFSLDQSVMNAYYATYSSLLKENLPLLYKHFQETRLTPDLYLLVWVYTVFAKATHLDLASRLWDVFLRDGEEFLFRAAIGILKMFEQQLLTMDFLAGSKFLNRLPDDLSADKLFKCISQIKTNVGKLNFLQLLLTKTNAV